MLPNCYRWWPAFRIGGGGEQISCQESASAVAWDGAPRLRHNSVGSDQPVADCAGGVARSGIQFAGLLPSERSASLRDGRRAAGVEFRSLNHGSSCVLIVPSRSHRAGRIGRRGAETGGGNLCSPAQSSVDSIANRIALSGFLQPLPPQARTPFASLLTVSRF
jgi:hypothetical protein